jgi:DnaJ-class molecular chaperone
MVHPDRDPSPEGAELMARANAAFDVLDNSYKQYLAQLRSTHLRCEKCEGDGQVKRQLGFTRLVFAPCTACDSRGYFRKDPK